MASTSIFAKVRKLGTSWHVLCCCAWLVLVCFASYSGFLAIVIPFGIDDPSHSKELGELLLSVFNISRGSHRPQSSPIIAANFSLQDKATRYMHAPNTQYIANYL